MRRQIVVSLVPGSVEFACGVLLGVGFQAHRYPLRAGWLIFCVPGNAHELVELHGYGSHAGRFC